MIVITTPTGNIGSQVVQTLVDRGESVRVIVRDPAGLAETVRERVEVVPGSHGDPAVVDIAFAGADAVFWLVPPDYRAPSLHTAYVEFTRAAAQSFAASGVGHVVGVSALGRGTPVADRAGLVTATLAMDDLIAATGVPYRALTNPSFMENVLRQVDSISVDGVYVSTAAPDRKARLASTADIAATAAELLVNRSWSGRDDVAVLGPEDLSGNDMATIMSEVLGRPVRYERQSLDDLAATLARRGTSDAVVAGYRDMMQAKDDGLDDGVARNPQTASPTTFRAWCTGVLKPAVLARAASGAV